MTFSFWRDRLARSTIWILVICWWKQTEFLRIHQMLTARWRHSATYNLPLEVFLPTSVAILFIFQQFMEKSQQDKCWRGNISCPRLGTESKKVSCLHNWASMTYPWIQEEVAFDYKVASTDWSLTFRLNRALFLCIVDVKARNSKSICIQNSSGFLADCWAESTSR